MISRLISTSARAVALLVLMLVSVSISAQSRRSTERAPSSAKPATSTKSAFSVQSFSPAGLADPKDPLVVVFTTDVMTSEILKSSKGRITPLSIDPSAEGDFTWLSPRVLQFKPRKPWRAGNDYSVRVNPELKDISGASSSGNGEFTFMVAPPSLIAVDQVGFDNESRAVLKLTFSGIVDPTVLTNHVDLLSQTSATLTWEVVTDKPASQINIRTEKITDSSIVVRVNPGLRGVEGPAASIETVERLAPLKMTLTPMTIVSDWELNKPSLRIRFNATVSAQTAKEFISISPNMPFDVDDSYQNLLLTGDFKPGQKIDVLFKAGLRSSDGHLMVQPLERSVWIADPKPFLEMMTGNGVLSPLGGMQLLVRSRGHDNARLSIAKLYESNLLHYDVSNRSNTVLLGPETETTLPLQQRDDHGISRIDLKPLLGDNAFGRYRMALKEVSPEEEGAYRGRREGHSVELVVSNLGLVANVLEDSALIWAGALDSAQPVASASVAVYNDAHQKIGEGQTDAQGFYKFSITGKDRHAVPASFVVRSGEDTGLLVLDYENHTHSESDREAEPAVAPSETIFVSAERGAYRPGESVYLFGWARDKRGGNLASAVPLQVSVNDNADREVYSNSVLTANDGYFQTTVPLSARWATGYYTADVSPAGLKKNEVGMRGTAKFQIEEFIPNRLEVKLTAPEKRLATSETLSIGVEANELLGRPASDLEVSGRIQFSNAPFSPEGFEDYRYGNQIGENVSYDPVEFDPQVTGADGRSTLTATIPQLDHASRPISVETEISVNEFGRNITQKIRRVIDPVTFYIGIKDIDQSAGLTTRTIEVVTLRPDGSLLSNDQSLSATISRVYYNNVLTETDGKFAFHSKLFTKPFATFEIPISSGKGSTTFTPDASGTYYLEVADGTKASFAKLSMNAYVDSQPNQPWSLEQPEEVQFELSPKNPRVGETVNVLVKAPFAGTLLLTTSQNDVTSHSTFQMESNTLQIPMVLDEKSAPSLRLRAVVVRPVKTVRRWIPHRAAGEINVPVLPQRDALAVAFDKLPTARPGDTITAVVRVQDAQTSSPAQAAVVIWAVDEGVLSLTSFTTPDLFKFFTQVRNWVDGYFDLYSHLVPDLLPGAESVPGGGDGPESAASNLTVSERVKPVVLWFGKHETDANGMVRVEFTAPHHYGNLRLMAAVASPDNNFGHAQTGLTINDPLMVQDLAPRFLAPGDEAFLGVKLVNSTTASLHAQVAANLTGLADVTVQLPSTADIASSDSINLTAKVTAPPQRTGNWDYNYQATSGEYISTGTVRLPVRAASLPRIDHRGTFISAGETAEFAFDTAAYFPDTTTWTLSISPFPVSTLIGAFDYNHRYPHECTEQMLSRAFTMLHAEDLSTSIPQLALTPPGARTLVQEIIDNLSQRIPYGGNVAMWPGMYETSDYQTVYMAHFLVEASRRGYFVYNLPTVLSAVRELSNMELTGDGKHGHYTKVYALYVSALAGDRNLAVMEELRMGATLSGERLSMLAAAYRAAGIPEAADSLLKNSDDRQTTTTRELDGELYSPARELAIHLSARLESNPNDPRVRELAARLLEMRTGDRWESTHDNAFAIWALSRYFLSRPPGSGAGTVTTSDGRVVEVSAAKPFLESGAAMAQPFKVSATTGSLHAQFRSGGVPLRPDTAAVNQGIDLQLAFTDRNGEAVDLTAIPQGSLVVVECQILTDFILPNTAIEMLLPAGLEIENARLDTQSGDEDSLNAGSGIAIDSIDIRDDRIRAYCTVYRRQKQSFKFLTRAVTPGEFILPAARIEAMYDPQINGSTASGRITILPSSK